MKELIEKAKKLFAEAARASSEAVGVPFGELECVFCGYAIRKDLEDLWISGEEIKCPTCGASTRIHLPEKPLVVTVPATMVWEHHQSGEILLVRRKL